MGTANVTERREQSPEVGVSVVILALAPPPEIPSGSVIGDSQIGGTVIDSSAIESSAIDNSAIGIDETILAERGHHLWIPLVKRTREPFFGQWALPGGVVHANMSLEESAFCALESTTSLHPQYLEQLYTFGSPQRSGQGLPMVSVVYWSVVDAKRLQRDGTIPNILDTDNVQWFQETDLPAMAFDHLHIVHYALQRLRSKIEYPDVVTKLVGDTFTLRQLHKVYEAIVGESIDVANFRRKILSSGELEDTGEKLSEGKQRPASVYRYKALSNNSDVSNTDSQRTVDEPGFESKRNCFGGQITQNVAVTSHNIQRTAHNVQRSLHNAQHSSHLDEVLSVLTTSGSSQRD